MQHLLAIRVIYKKLINFLSWFSLAIFLCGELIDRIREQNNWYSTSLMVGYWLKVMGR